MVDSTGYPGIVFDHIMGSHIEDGFDLAMRYTNRMDGVYEPDPFFRLMPFMPINSPRTVVPRVDTLATASPIDNDVTIVPDSSETTLVTPEFVAEMTSYVGDVCISEFAEKIFSISGPCGQIQQLPLQIGFKKMAILRAVKNDFYRNQVGQSILGLRDYANQFPSQVVSPGPAPLSLDPIDEIIYLCRGATGELSEKILVMHPNTLIKVIRLVRAAGYTLLTKMVNGFPQLCFNGVPMVPSYFVPEDETLGTFTNLTSIWCITPGYDANGLFFVIPLGVGDNGFVVEEVTRKLDADVVCYRIKWFLQLILSQKTGFARYEGIIC